MKFSRTFITIIFGASAAVSPALAQEEGSRSQEVSVQAIGSFVKSTTQDGIRQTATESGGVLANYRFFFTSRQGVEVDYGYASNSQLYGAGGGLGNVGSNTHEFSAAYVYRLRPRLVTPFALAGVGGLVFDPTNFVGASTQTRAAFVYGAGADIRLAARYFLRAQYRGFVYNSPTFGIDTLAGADRVTHRAEPSIGFGVRF